MNTKANISSSKAQVQCLICHRYYDAITPGHLATHGFTVSQYRRLYHTPSASSPLIPQSDAPRSRHPGPIQAANALLADPSFMASLADEVQDHLFSGPMRQRLKLSLAAVLMARLEAHGKAMSLLDSLRSELARPWRREAGGKNGGPTSNEDLVKMMKTAIVETRQGEELVTKTARLLLEELRANPAASYDDAHHFSGSAARVTVPTDLSAPERETARNLVNMLLGGASKLAPSARPPERVIGVKSATGLEEDKLDSKGTTERQGRFDFQGAESSSPRPARMKLADESAAGEF